MYFYACCGEAYFVAMLREFKLFFLTNAPSIRNIDIPPAPPPPPSKPRAFECFLCPGSREFDLKGHPGSWEFDFALVGWGI